ncbi:murein biosynthesis integral membrane protein MurJ [bacterium E08(2017)]|nr:murein biosynthesis integral membrane protein MurJ [bacterium E08(2017)]
MSESKSVLKSASLVSACTGASRLLGFLRMWLMARVFGTSLVASAFFVAFSIPNLFRRLFGEGALSAAFVPVFTESIEKDGIEEANRLAGKVATMLAAAMLCIIFAGLIFVTVWMERFELGPKAATVLPLLRIMLPYMFFICMVALCMGILNSRKHFFVPAATPVLLNVIWIAMLLFVCPRFADDSIKQITALAWGIMAAGVVQLLIQVPVMLKHGIRLKIDFAWQDEKVKRVLLLMGPAALGMGALQLNTALGRVLAIIVDPQAPAALIYADLIVYLPLGLFGTAWSTVLLPAFSSHSAREEKDKMLATLSLGMRSIMFVLLPASVGLTVLSTTLIKGVFQGGMFNVESTVFTSRALAAFAPGLLFFGMYKILVAVFYSLKDTKSPVVVALLQVALNIVLMVAFIVLLPDGYKHAGIAFASVLSFGLSCVHLCLLIHKKVGNPGWRDVLISGTRSLTAALVMGVTVFLLDRWLSGMSAFSGLARLFACVIAGILTYFLLALVLCRRELSQLRK